MIQKITKHIYKNQNLHTLYDRETRGVEKEDWIEYPKSGKIWRIIFVIFALSVVNMLTYHGSFAKEVELRQLCLNHADGM